MPWLDVPLYRLAEIHIEPLYPRGGLLGGSPANGGEKVSKLAALAAARKRKENEKSADVPPNQQPTSSVALLDKLSNTRKPPEKTTSACGPLKNKTTIATSRDERSKAIAQSRRYSPRRRKSKSPPSRSEELTEKSPMLIREDSYYSTPIVSSPSLFARTILGPCVSQRPNISGSLTKDFSPMHLSGVSAESNPFIGPSPDDIVANAQNSKGLSVKIFRR